MFQPVLPIQGYGGWQFLQRTLDQQRDTFQETPVVKRLTEAFEEKIGTVLTAGQLVEDRDLLQVALGAFGLDEDIGNTFFIRRILEDGTLDPAALSNRLSDVRYRNFADAFGFGANQIPKTIEPDFASDIIEQYQARQFERAVGDQNDDFRLSLNVEPAIAEILKRSNDIDAQWFSVMGTPPLRKVFEVAFGLPSSFAQIDLDQQLEVLKDRSRSLFGDTNLASISQKEQTEKLIRLFLLRSEAEAAVLPQGQIALSLLQS
ncbi:DUF1217 domain-containing protein [Aestuariibius insulae]|uniref:DUF1217 domain-containing protein n=1 Tax=Aestuariibius insulae TaxID=2058287 RepID=UPI00345E55FD